MAKKDKKTNEPRVTRVLSPDERNLAAADPHFWTLRDRRRVTIDSLSDASLIDILRAIRAERIGCHPDRLSVLELTAARNRLYVPEPAQSPRQGFLKSLVECRPGSAELRAARMVYADWLYEHGDLVQSYCQLWLAHTGKVPLCLDENGGAESYFRDDRLSWFWLSQTSDDLGPPYAPEFTRPLVPMALPEVHQNRHRDRRWDEDEDEDEDEYGYENEDEEEEEEEEEDEDEDEDEDSRIATELTDRATLFRTVHNEMSDTYRTSQSVRMLRHLSIRRVSRFGSQEEAEGALGLALDYLRWLVPALPADGRKA